MKPEEIKDQELSEEQLDEATGGHSNPGGASSKTGNQGSGKTGNQGSGKTGKGHMI